MDYREEFKRVLLSRPHCILGKSGITDDFITHVVSLLKRYKIIKIKALRSIATKSNIATLSEKISKLTNASVLDLRGKQIILSKFPINKKELKSSSK
ncbi:MAG: YhbY family RNA-binding protein [Candidatus Odinarchaeota archaeon]